MKYLIYNPFPQNHIFFVKCLKLFYLEQGINVEEIQKVKSYDNDNNIIYFILIYNIFYYYHMIMIII